MFTKPIEMSTIDYLTHQFPQSVLEWTDELDESFYSFTATCHDQTGSGIDDGSLNFAFTIDVTEPNKPVITTQSPMDVKADFTIEGTIDTIDDEDKYIFLKGHEEVNTLVSDDDTFTLTIHVSALYLGENTISVIAKDSAGNEGPESDPIIVNYVITAPQFQKISPESGSTKKEVTEILVEFTLVNEVPIDFTRTTMEVSKGPLVLGRITQVSNTEINFTPIDSFTNGVYDVGITVYDQLGNSESYEKSFTVDDRAPIPIINESLIPSHTNSPQINIVGTVSDANHDIIAVTINVYDENNNIAIPETPVAISDVRSVSINETITLVEDGTYRIVVSAMNDVPVESSSDPIYVSLDRIEPEADIIIG